MDYLRLERLVRRDQLLGRLEAEDLLVQLECPGLHPRVVELHDGVEEPVEPQEEGEGRLLVGLVLGVQGAVRLLGLGPDGAEGVAARLVGGAAEELGLREEELGDLVLPGLGFEVRELLRVLLEGLEDARGRPGAFLRSCLQRVEPRARCLVQVGLAEKDLVVKDPLEFAEFYALPFKSFLYINYYELFNKIILYYYNYHALQINRGIFVRNGSLESGPKETF